MMTRITLIAVFATLASCSNQPENTIQSSDISKLESLPNISNSQFNLQLDLENGKKTLISRTKSGRIGSSVRFSKLNKFTYVSSYDLPKNNIKGKFPTTPANPIKTESMNIGWTAQFVGRLSGGLVILEGEITNISTKLRRGVYGEASDKIVVPVSSRFVTVTENKGEMPTIFRTTYPLTIRTIPNKDYYLTLPDGTKLHVKLQTK